jgi:pimeloyl-ACP methyl ester carboxylesterase
LSVYPHGDAEIFYQTHGSGPALLLICGGPGVSAVYEGLTDRLTEEWTVITYDLPGHARSRGRRTATSRWGPRPTSPPGC